MFYAQGSIIVHRTVEEVFALLPYAATSNMQGTSRLENAAQEGISINRSLPAGKIEVGTIFETQVQRPGRQSVTTFKVIELEPDRKLTLEQHSVGSVSMSSFMRYELEPVYEGTKLTVRGEMETQGRIPLLVRLFLNTRRMYQSSISLWLDTLKRTLEQGILLQPGYRASGPLPALDESQLPTEAPK